jgi:effector-binding domain-containing protein
VAALKKIVVALAVLVVLLAAIGMLLPRHSHVERSIVIGAPRATVYALVDGFKPFGKWSPWASLDPNMKVVIEGPPFGVGAKQSWSGDPKTVGTGSQEIVEAKPYDSVTSKLDFGAQGVARSSFLLGAERNGTKVTWTLDTDNGAGPVRRYFGLLLDRFVGPDYEKGLASLKSLAEGLPKDDFGDLVVASIDAVPITVAYLPARSSTDMKEIGAAIGAAYMRVGAFMKANKLKQAGAPITINTRFDESGYEFDAAIPVDRAPERVVPADSPVKVKSTYGGKALKVTVTGPYAGMQPAYAKLRAFMAARGYQPAGPPWDAYVTDPGSTPEAELKTDIVQPVK